MISSYRLVNLIGFRLTDGLADEGLKVIYGQLHDASGKTHPWLTTPSSGADPSRRRTGRKPSGRAAAARPDGPPSDWARKHGWKSEAENMKSMASFLSATGNAGTVMEIAKKTKKVTTDG